MRLKKSQAVLQTQVVFIKVKSAHIVLWLNVMFFLVMTMF